MDYNEMPFKIPKESSTYEADSGLIVGVIENTIK